jgi:hypothetical protein
MTNEANCRHQLYLDKHISEKLQALAAKPGASKSAILADAVQAWLTGRGTKSSTTASRSGWSASARSSPASSATSRS